MSSSATHPLTEAGTPSLQIRCLPHSPVQPQVTTPLSPSLSIYIFFLLFSVAPFAGDVLANDLYDKDHRWAVALFSYMYASLVNPATPLVGAAVLYFQAGKVLA
ncbi:uncharacterized protein LY79DRAFT_564147 [Colletotrichum navitas]|uniref:Uncharacterized protein n=1 Tax=Colletotrichum navitas TaxID=681940 RepID=A0AAD8PRK9_9PEZI|nr:uncharacterized protein LY79DRAFT_564147 [Colletotrichum navitas]KAK1579436.1 hypothetical protein LY79DRAFT_564147 [Colletotrichum navitas]